MIGDIYFPCNEATFVNRGTLLDHNLTYTGSRVARLGNNANDTTVFCGPIHNTVSGFYDTRHDRDYSTPTLDIKWSCPTHQLTASVWCKTKYVGDVYHLVVNGETIADPMAHLTYGINISGLFNIGFAASVQDGYHTDDIWTSMKPVFIHTTGEYRIYTQIGGANWSSAGASDGRTTIYEVDCDGWHHYCITVNATSDSSIECCYYYDGYYKTKITYNRTLLGSMSIARFGLGITTGTTKSVYHASNGSYSGQCEYDYYLVYDDINIFNRVLSDLEIQELAKGLRSHIVPNALINHDSCGNTIQGNGNMRLLTANDYPRTDVRSLRDQTFQTPYFANMYQSQIRNLNPFSLLKEESNFSLVMLFTTSQKTVSDTNKWVACLGTIWTSQTSFIRIYADHFDSVNKRIGIIQFRKNSFGQYSRDEYMDGGFVCSSIIPHKVLLLYCRHNNRHVYRLWEETSTGWQNNTSYGMAKYADTSPANTAFNVSQRYDEYFQARAIQSIYASAYDNNSTFVDYSTGYTTGFIIHDFQTYATDIFEYDPYLPASTEQLVYGNLNKTLSIMSDNEVFVPHGMAEINTMPNFATEYPALTSSVIYLASGGLVAKEFQEDPNISVPQIKQNGIFIAPKWIEH